jgi:HEAT repeat protein
MNRRLPIFLVPLLMFAAAAAAAAQEPDAASADWLTLRDAHVGTDAPALLTFFRKRTPDDAALQRLRLLVRQLGDPSFRTRERACHELVAFGRVALPALQPVAGHPDLEVSRRALECIKAIEASDDNGLACAAARRLAVLKPAGTAEVLLAYIPFADSSLVKEQVTEALKAVAVENSREEPALLRALADADPERRATAADVLARAGGNRDRLAKLLDDPSPSVRLRVALSLMQKGSRAAVPVLINLLGELPPEQTWQAKNVLSHLAEDKAPPEPAGHDAGARQRYRAAWAAWWRAEGPSIDAEKLRHSGGVLGYTLVVLIDAGKVLQVDSAGRTQWQVEGLQTPLDAQLLARERVLVAENGANRVTERNAAGRILWEHSIPTPVMAQRLPNGNTFMASQTNFLEVDANGKEVLNLQVPNVVYKAMKMPNGDIAYISGDGHFVRLNRDGRQLSSFAAHVDYYGGRVDVLSNGHVVVPEANNNRLMEFDDKGNVAWEIKMSGQPVAASRLANGNTLVTCYGWHRGVEVDRRGREVWEYKSDSRVTRLIRRGPHEPPTP